MKTSPDACCRVSNYQFSIVEGLYVGLRSPSDAEVLADRTAINTMVRIAVGGYSLAVWSLRDRTRWAGCRYFRHERSALYLSLFSAPDGSSFDNCYCVYGNPVPRVRISS